MIATQIWTISCGARNLGFDKTSTPEDIIYSRKINFIPAFFYFSETRTQNPKEKTAAQKLIAYIKKHNLGTIKSSKPVTKRKVTQTWFWIPNKNALKTHTLK